MGEDTLGRFGHVLGEVVKEVVWERFELDFQGLEAALGTTRPRAPEPGLAFAGDVGESRLHFDGLLGTGKGFLADALGFGGVEEFGGVARAFGEGVDQP